MKKNELIIDGQLSLFDIQITEEPKKVTKIEYPFTKGNGFVTENKESFIEKTLEVTNQQQKIIDSFKTSQLVNRIIIYSKGSIGIEVREAEKFITHYITREGKEEFSFSNKSPVLPWDKIFYYSSYLKNITLPKIQVDKLQKILCKQRENIKRVVHRKGDENILVEFTDKIISITPIGWELPFESMDHIDCEEDEVYMIPEKIPQKTDEENLVSVQKKAKIGDYVQAMHGKKLIEGELFSEYNSGYTFNIIFENGDKHTAIPRAAIKKILKSE